MWVIEDRNQLRVAGRSVCIQRRAAVPVSRVLGCVPGVQPWGETGELREARGNEGTGLVHAGHEFAAVHKMWSVPVHRFANCA